MSDTLLLVPTQYELSLLDPAWLEAIHAAPWSVALCGFGLIAAAARTVDLIHQIRPDRVVLLGIAGSMDDRLQVGQAARFSEVVCYGIGSGSGEDFSTAAELGWKQWPGATLATLERIADASEDLISFASPSSNLQLLSCTSASGSQSDVRLKQRKFPQAAAEDMEGYAVAAACRMLNVPLEIVRGISNRAGDRDHRNWKAQTAILAGARMIFDSEAAK